MSPDDSSSPAPAPPPVHVAEKKPVVTDPATTDTTESGADAAAEPEFSVFTAWQKRGIIFLAAFASMFSPMSSFIFYPAVTSIADDLAVTVSLVNLAVTTYMVVSGIVPALLGSAADRFGRRPVYLLALSTYLAANLGLSLQSTYPGLLVLRMLQSAGSSGTIALGYGVVSDITTRAEWGFIVGILLIGPNVAPPLGPILGGALTAGLGWKWIFRFLSISGGACLVLVWLALPETSRIVVGNGSKPATGIHRVPLSVLVSAKNTLGDSQDTISPLSSRGNTHRPAPPNPLACLKLLLIKDVAGVIVCNGVNYTIACCIQASLSTLFIEVYGYRTLEAGLIYIPFGVACLVSTFVWGKFLNFSYNRTARLRGIPIDRARQGSLDDFPIRRARLSGALYLVIVVTAATVGYGWAVRYRVHVSVPLILLVLIGFCITGLFVALGTLLTDLNPDRSATAAASANLVRCALAAAALAALQPIIDGVGAGWCFTILGAISAACALLLRLLILCDPSQES